MADPVQIQGIDWGPLYKTINENLIPAICAALVFAGTALGVWIRTKFMEWAKLKAETMLARGTRLRNSMHTAAAAEVAKRDGKFPNAPLTPDSPFVQGMVEHVKAQGSNTQGKSDDQLAAMASGIATALDPKTEVPPLGLASVPTPAVAVTGDQPTVNVQESTKASL